MAKLFEPAHINGMTLRNRVVRSATFEGMANPDGSCTPRLVELMGTLARGGVGLIMTGYAYVNQRGKSRPGQLGVHSHELIPGLAEMASCVHREGGKIAMQIAHAGCNSYVLPQEQPALGPSCMNLTGHPCESMAVDEITTVVGDFAAAAKRAHEAGFDGVQLHGAHGYLLSQFLSPYYNKRADGYGGPLEKRARLTLEVFRAVRAAVGESYPVMIKINSDDYLEGGFTRQEMVRLAEMLEREGIDAIEISGGTHLSPPEYSFSRPTGVVPEDQELYFAEAATLYKSRVTVPLILVGGIRSYGVAERVLEDGLADFVSLCRPFIREPGLVRRWETGDRRRAACISCNRCLGPARAAEGAYCVAEEQQRTKAKNAANSEG